jgi:hypothetical protein
VYLGVLLLDLDVVTFQQVVDRLIDDFGYNNDLNSEVRKELFRTLLLPHRFVDGQHGEVKQHKVIENKRL